MLKVKALLSAPLAVGTNAYAPPAMTEGGGTPEMTGAELPGAVTTMLNGASHAVLCPSLTPMTMLL
jgi:hypothetical protein